MCVVDDSNDHILSVWDWQREERLAEVKVTTLCKLSYLKFQVDADQIGCRHDYSCKKIENLAVSYVSNGLNWS